MPRIKYGNFMITGFMGALVGLMVTFQTSSIDPSNASYQTMFYAIAGAVIGGTALASGSGTIIGAFLGALMLSILQDGFNLIGISANPLPIIFGGAILIAMIANVQLARLRRAGRRMMSTPEPDGQRPAGRARRQQRADGRRRRRAPGRAHLRSGSAR